MARVVSIPPLLEVRQDHDVEILAGGREPPASIRADNCEGGDIGIVRLGGLWAAREASRPAPQL
jgi:hypothetical protein